MIFKLCNKLGFDLSSAQYFQEVYNKISQNKECNMLLKRAENLFFDRESTEYTSDLQKISEIIGIHRYTVDMVFVLSCSERAHKIYASRGIPDEIYFDTMADAKYKLEECKNVYGVLGTFVGWWFKKHCLADLVALGRVQFEKIPFPYESYGDVLKRGDTVYNFHVPASGSLDKASLIDSFKRAYSFYSSELKNGIMPIYFSSWLIYPPTAALYKSGSNLESFYELFDIIDTDKDEKNRDAWRVFNQQVTNENISTLPENTSLQRSLKAYLGAGNCMGKGIGVLLFDGENIIK